jgi:UDP-N-acetylmuramyl pentapeptide synthase
MTPWLREHCPCDVITFGTSAAAMICATRIRTGPWGSEFELPTGAVCRLSVPGRHNVMNALAAIAASVAVGMPAQEAAERLGTFSLSPMRLARETVAEVTLINDAYNANLHSMEAALRVLDEMAVGGRRVMLCGDMLELGPRSVEFHRQLGARICQSGVRVLVTVGRLARVVGDVARHSATGVEVHQCDTAAEAAERLAVLLRPRDVLLAKGSRAMRLEQALELLKVALAQRTRGEAAQDSCAGVRSAAGVSGCL